MSTKKKILIIDDDHELNNLLTLYLTKFAAKLEMK
jgi:DNA-binding response OmpR family regulator